MLRIKPEFQLKNIAGDYIVISSGSSVVDLTGSFTLNETGALLWQTIEKGCYETDLLNALTKEYDVSEAQAAADVKAFVQDLRERNMLDE